MNIKHSTLAALALLAGSVASQNLITNGDFSNGMTGWSFSGYTVDPTVVSFDTNGLGANNAFSNLPGQKTFGVPVTYNMEQQFVSVPTTFEFSADIAALQTNSPKNADGGTIEVFVGTQKIASHSFGSIAGNRLDLKRERLCARFTPTAIGRVNLSIRFSRRYLTAKGLTPRNYIDNVSLRRTSGPVVCFRGERKVSTKSRLEVVGTPNDVFVLLAAPKPIATPITVPGFGGTLELDPLSLQVIVGGSLGSSGTAGFDLTAPPALAAVPIYWQAAGIGTAGNDFGPSALIGFYK